MAKKTVIMTVCDRCGSEERTERPAKCYITPPESKKSGVTWELCSACDSSLDDFMNLHKVEAREGE